MTSTNAKIQTRKLDRRLSSDTVAELVAAYQSGVSTNQLCEQYSISKGGVLKLLADHGVAMRQQPMTDAEINQAVHLYVRE
ncbi:hypothetical protein ACNO8X_14565 [Mycobacterium sp. PDNC021]|uniref:hypothetical protein n=1 Tax=Mycobacterium sp. PDNC021 TaxID=3391399 RepID=UPI003AAEE064